MTPEVADRFAAIALGHVTREYPNKLDHVLAGPDDIRGPRALHPVFYGSFDWHSCVHGYWMLAHLYRRFPAMPHAASIRALFDAQLVTERIAGECRYLAGSSASGFERPYGWAWLLKLAAELALHETAEGRAWSAALEPLARIFAARFTAYLPLATYPVRAGVHSNTAFAVRLALDYRDAALGGVLTQAARRWYSGPRLPGVGAGGRRVPLARADRGGVHAGGAARAGFPCLVRRVSASGWSGGTRFSVQTCHRQRPERRQDRASGRA